MSAFTKRAKRRPVKYRFELPIKSIAYALSEEIYIGTERGKI